MADASCSTLSKKEKKLTLSAQKGKKHSGKLVLDSPFTKGIPRVPVISSEHPFVELLTGYISQAKLTSPTFLSYRATLAIGVNAVYKKVRNGKVLGVILSDDVKPPTFIEHIIALCHKRNVPVAYLSEMRKTTYTSIGFECIAMGFLDPVRCDKIQQMLRELSPPIEPVLIPNEPAKLPETSRPLLEVKPMFNLFGELEPMCPKLDVPVEINSDGFIPLKAKEVNHPFQSSLEDTPRTFRNIQKESGSSRFFPLARVDADGEEPVDVGYQKSNKTPERLNVMTNTSELEMTPNIGQKQKKKKMKKTPEIFSKQGRQEITPKIGSKKRNKIKKKTHVALDPFRTLIIETAEGTTPSPKQNNLTQFGVREKKSPQIDSLSRLGKRKNKSPMAAENFIPLAGTSAAVESRPKKQRKWDVTANETDGDVPRIKYKKSWVLDKTPTFIPPSVLKITPNPARANKRKRSQK